MEHAAHDPESDVLCPDNVFESHTNTKGWTTTKIVDITVLNLRIALVRWDYRFNQTFVIAGVPEHDTSRVVGMVDTYGDIIIIRSAPRKEQLIAGKLLRQYKREMAMLRILANTATCSGNR